jgi:nicotinate-nucleotide adenylyltransferase
VHLAPAGGIAVIAITALDISATLIRDCLRTGTSPRYLLPDSVLDYIQTRQLYS